MGCSPSSLRPLRPFSWLRSDSGDYVRLQMESLCVISDSGAVTEEAALLSLPAVTIHAH